GQGALTVSIRGPIRIAVFCSVLFGWTTPSLAQSVRGSTVDQTGLPLPGVMIQLTDGGTVVQSLLTDANGLFVIDTDIAWDVLLASLDGFEPQRVARRDASRIVLAIARTEETTTVVAPASVESSPTAALLGSTLTAANV